MEHLALEPSEPLDTEFQTCRYETHVWPLAQGIFDDGLVLVHCDGACRVDDVPARRRVGRDRVDGAEDELFLEVREELEVALGLKISIGRGSQQFRRRSSVRHGERLMCGFTKHAARELKAAHTLLTLTLASLLMTPVPEHGASNNTLSNPPMTLGNSLAS
jgi:hypothetical protein